MRPTERRAAAAVAAPVGAGAVRPRPVQPFLPFRARTLKDPAPGGECYPYNTGIQVGRNPSEPEGARLPVKGAGTKQKPWELKTPSGLSEFQDYRDESRDAPA